MHEWLGKLGMEEAEPTTLDLQDVNMVELAETCIEPKLVSVRDHWDWIKDGVEEVLTYANQKYRPEDVYTYCIIGKAQLWVTNEGFVITMEEKDDMALETFCYIWIAWAKERGGALSATHQHFFERKAKEAGYDGLKLRTNEYRIAKYVETNGWDLETIELVRRF